jgi:transposase
VAIVKNDNKSVSSIHSGEKTTNGKSSNKVSDKSTRRRFTPEYKLEILRQLEECRGTHGAVGEFLRREGLYSSQVSDWKREFDANLSKAFSTKRGPKPDPAEDAKKQISDLEKKVARLEKQLGQAHSVIDIQKKLSMILGVQLPEE